MSIRAHGHARVSSRFPQAAGICDRCGRLFTHSRLAWQYDWRGEQLQNLRVLVCDTGCMDVPQQQLRARILPADPVPIMNARPEPFTTTGVSYQEIQFIVSENEIEIVTEGGTFICAEGQPPFGAVVPDDSQLLSVGQNQVLGLGSGFVLDISEGTP